MSIELKNIQQLDVDSNGWREDFNGEGYQVHCDECMIDEEDVETMYMFHFVNNNFILCNGCLSKMKLVLLQNVV